MKNDSLSIQNSVLEQLCRKKLLTKTGIEKAVARQKEKGGKLSDILVAMGLVSRKNLVSALSKELSIPPIDLSRYRISPDALKLIPEKVAKHYRVFPISCMGKILTVAIADPLDVFAIDDIKVLTNCKINVVIADEKDIEEAFSEHYATGAREAIVKIIEDMKPEGDIEVLEEKSELTASKEIGELIDDAPVVKIANMLLAEAVKMRASDILIEPLEQTLRIRYRIDGILREAQSASKKLHTALISRLKVISNLNIAEKRLPQDGRFKAKIQNREIDFRISVMPSSNGEKAALRILDKSQAMLDLDKLGFEPEPLRMLKDAAERPYGMILSCGPTGCGKTTTLYALLKHLDSPDKNIITAEDPVEYQLEGINQLTVRPKLKLTFSSALRSFLRQDPDIIMVGEIRDFETVDIAIKSALTGHLVLSTLHTTTASGSIVRLINMGVEPFLITSSVVLIAAQRLVRQICEKCKEQHKIDEETARKLQVPNGGKNMAYRGKGCKACQNTGYRGRVGLIETLTLSPGIRNLILEKAEEHKIKEAARREGMRTLRESGVRKVLAGITTIEEIIRVTVGDQDLTLR